MIPKGEDMNKNILKYLLLLISISLLFLNCTRSFDIIIIGGTLFDGNGTKGYSADIGIRDGRISKIGKINSSLGKKVIIAKGKLVVPGFIDIHTHGDRGLRDPQRKSVLNYLTQGVTTLVTGNCGSGTYKVSEYFSQLEERGVGTNVVHLVGHGTIREEVMQYEDRDPTEEERQRMISFVEMAMHEGAAGLSTGLFYAPGSYAKTEEIIQLCSVVSQHGGLYATHIRDESDYSIGLKAAIHEAIEIGEKSEISVQISHIKALGRPVWGSADDVCQIIEEARSRGVKVTADQYPYIASSTGLVAAVVPRWIQADDKMEERLIDKKLLPRIKMEISQNIERRGGADTLVISSFSQKPEWEGKSLKEISGILNESYVDSAIKIVLMGGPSVLSFNMTDADVENFMKKSYVATGSDGHVLLFGEELPHPRSYGTFPRKIRRYVYEKELLSMEQAIRSMTGLPAEILGLEERGIIKEGYIADILVFDPDKIQDKATFDAPHQYSDGIDHVLIQGRIVIEDGEFNGTLAGKPLRFRTHDSKT